MPDATSLRKPLSTSSAVLVVICASLAMTATLPARTVGLGIVAPQIVDEIPSLTDTLFGWMNFVATLLGALLCVPCGWLLDRYGTKLVSTLVVLALAAVIMWLTFVTNAWLLAVVLVLLRGLGQSMLSVVALTMMGKSFPRQPGLPMGAFAVLMTFLMAVCVGSLESVSQSAGADWRGTWFAMSLVWIGIAAFQALLGPSRKQEVAIATAFAVERDSQQQVGATLKQALATPCFWIFAFACSLLGLVSAGFTLYFKRILVEHGFAEQMYMIFMVIGMFVGMAANMAGGYYAKVWKKEKLLSLSMVLLALAMVGIAFASSDWHLILLAVINGCAGGLVTVLFFAVWADAYGTRELGRIQGAAQAMTVFASAIGPVLVSQSRAQFGSYTAVLIAFGVCATLLAILSYFTPVPSAARGDWDGNEQTDAKLPEVDLAVETG